MALVNDYFQENLTLLQEHHPALWQIISNYKGEPPGEFRLAQDGTPNLLVYNANGEKVFLHDTTDTAAELPSYYELVPKQANGVAMFLGMGLGYTPEAMLESRPHLQHMIVFEPETGIFIQALHARDLSKLINSKKVTLAIGPNINAADVLSPISRTLRLESIFVLKHTPCFRIASETYQNLHDEVYKLGSEFNIDGNTTTSFGGKFIENRLHNMTTIHHQHLLENLHNAFVDVPAIIVAGGPSLDKNIHLLSKAVNRAVIIAADTTLPALTAHGITPDFTTSIDMQDITLEKIIDVADQNRATSLVCSSWLTPQVTKNFPARQVYWSFAAKNMENWLNRLLNGKMLTGGAGTVAQLSFTSAYTLGCSPIIFVGQDLSFGNHESHAQHTSLTSQKELIFFNNSDEYILVEAYGGQGQVRTSRSMMSHKQHFEHAISAINDRHFINATEGGVRIKGTEEYSLQEVLEKYCTKELDIKGQLKEVEKHGNIPTRRKTIEKLTKTIKIITSVKKDMALLESKVKKINQEINHIVEAGMTCRKFESLPASMQQDFQKLDALNAKLDKAKVWALLEEATIEGLRLSERLNHEILQLAEQPEKYLEWLRKAVERFTVINQVRRQVLSPFNNHLKTLINFFRQEDSLLRSLSKAKSSNEEATLRLLRLYQKNGEHVLLEQAIADYFPNHADSADLAFYSGLIAAHRSQFKQMEEHFSRAMKLDQTWAAQIEQCRQELAVKYLGFFRYWRKNDRSVACRMLFKAVRYNADYQALHNTIATEAADILKLAEGNDRENLLAVWSKELEGNRNLLVATGPEQAVKFHSLYGEMLLAQNKPSAARQVISLAISLTSDEPELYFSLLNACFAIGDYPAGIAALEKAVALDISYAAAWETIGDNLQANGQFQDAALAYEKCFKALPAEIDLLQKIAACYQNVAS